MYAKLCISDILRFAVDARGGKVDVFFTLCQVFAADKGWSVATGLPCAAASDDRWILSHPNDQTTIVKSSALFFAPINSRITCPGFVRRQYLHHISDPRSHGGHDDSKIEGLWILRND